MHTFEMNFDGTGETSIVELEESELELLEEFLGYARDLEQTKIVAMGMPFQYNVEWSASNSSLRSSTVLPDWSLVQVYLHKIRPIILEGEETNFYKICNLIGRRFASSRIRRTIDDEKQLYQGANIHLTMKVYANDQLLTCEKVFQTFLNGFEYHRDREKRDYLEELHSLLPVESSRVLWYWLLQEKGGAILRMAEFVRTIIDAHQGIVSPRIRVELLG